MTNRIAARTRRWMLFFAALPLLQFSGCAGEFLASALAAESATRVSNTLFLSLETALLNVLGA